MMITPPWHFPSPRALIIYLVEALFTLKNSKHRSAAFFHLLLVPLPDPSLPSVAPKMQLLHTFWKALNDGCGLSLVFIGTRQHLVWRPACDQFL